MAPVSLQFGVQQFWGLSYTFQPCLFQQRCSKVILPFSLCSRGHQPWAGCPVPQV